MARYAVGSLSSGSSASTHALLVSPTVALGIAGAEGSENTTKVGVVSASFGFSTGAETSVAGSSVANQRTVYMGSHFSGSSARTTAGGVSGFAKGVSSGGSLMNANYLVRLASTIVGVSEQTTAAPNNVANVPVGFALLGGDDVLAFVTTSPPAVSTVAGSTQASTGYGFQPNAAIILGQSFVSTVASMSFGFACVDTAGNRSQWSIGQGSREAAVAQVNRVSSTARALSLLVQSAASTIGSVSHAVSVTSFKADGLELTVSASDTARAATISVLGLQVPKVAAGKATITTNGVGAGQTGVTVTGLGPNVGLVIIASNFTSHSSVLIDNDFSIGFASSDGSQRSVSGRVLNNAATSGYASYFSSTRAVTKMDTPAGGAGAVLHSQGLFAATSDGFTITFSNTNANGHDLFWGAFMNIVTDIGGTIQSSFSAASGLKFIGGLGGSVQTSFAAALGLKEVGHIGGSVQDNFDLALGLTPDFFPGESVHHSYLKHQTEIQQDADIGLGRGSWNASDRFLIVTENSSSPDIEKEMNITTVRQRIGIAEYGNAKVLQVLPPSTNSVPIRIAAGRSGLGMTLNPRGLSAWALAERIGSDAYLFTTESGTTIEKVRVKIL